MQGAFELGLIAILFLAFRFGGLAKFFQIDHDNPGPWVLKNHNVPIHSERPARLWMKSLENHEGHTSMFRLLNCSDLDQVKFSL